MQTANLRSLLLEEHEYMEHGEWRPKRIVSQRPRTIAALMLALLSLAGVLFLSSHAPPTPTVSRPGTQVIRLRKLERSAGHELLVAKSTIQSRTMSAMLSMALFEVVWRVP